MVIGKEKSSLLWQNLHNKLKNNVVNLTDSNMHYRVYNEVNSCLRYAPAGELVWLINRTLIKWE